MIWRVDPIVFDRIRVGFHRNPTSFIKNRSDPTRFLSDSFRSESGPDFIGIQRSAIKSGQIRSSLFNLGIFLISLICRDRWFKLNLDRVSVSFDCLLLNEQQLVLIGIWWISLCLIYRQLHWWWYERLRSATG